MIDHSRALVLIPRDKTLRELITIIRETYGLSFNLPDRYGLLGIQTVTVQATGSTSLTLQTMTGDHLVIYGLKPPQAFGVCKELIGYLPLPRAAAFVLLPQLIETMSSTEKVC